MIKPKCTHPKRIKKDGYKNMCGYCWICVFCGDVQNGDLMDKDEILRRIINKKGGLRRLPDTIEDKPCSHREHEPPGMLYLKPGRYEYTCPGCGYVTYFTVPETRCDTKSWEDDGKSRKLWARLQNSEK